MIVLIIDDEPLSRRVLRRLLSRFPEIDLREAEDGQVALNQLAEYTPALIFCDLLMPVMDGVTFMRQVRASEAWRHIPMIVTSASKDRELLGQVKDLQVADYLLKPFDLVQTFARIEKHLDPLLKRFRAEKAAAAEAERAAAQAAAEAAAQPQQVFTAPAPVPPPDLGGPPAGDSATAA